MEKRSEQRTLPIIYFVLPCFNEHAALPSTHRVLDHKMTELIDTKLISPQSRVLFVDDGSSDTTWQLIRSYHEHNPRRFGGVKLAHNRGHQNALLAGLMTALKSGCDAAISMDADLQDDVNASDEMIRDYCEGAEIVYGVRNNRDTDTWFKRTSAEAFYRLMRVMGADTISNHADYRLMGRSALEALSDYREVNLFLRGIVPSLGFASKKVYYRRGKRVAGTSKYPLHKMISFAMDGMTSFSTELLKVPSFLGGFSLIVAIGMLIYTIVSAATGHAVPGWASIMCSLWFIAGLIMISLGIVGEYIGKIYMESKHRPRYCIEESI